MISYFQSNPQAQLVALTTIPENSATEVKGWFGSNMEEKDLDDSHLGLKF